MCKVKDFSGANGDLISSAERANLPLIPPYLQPASKLSQVPLGVNFASSGAGALVQTFRGSVCICMNLILIIDQHSP